MFNLKIVDRVNLSPRQHYQKGDFNALIPGKDYDCVITPGNSFGIMDGGFDKVIANKFPNSQDLVQIAIENFCGEEMPVGQAIIVSLGSNLQLCYAPTMRFPGPAKEKDIAYWAALAAFRQIAYFNKMTPDRKISEVVMPLFCTATGGMPAEVSYDQIVYAYQRVAGYSTNPPKKGWGSLLAHRDKLKSLSSWVNTRTGR